MPTSRDVHHAQLRPQSLPSISREFVYVANAGSNDVSVFAVHSGGALKEVAGSPFAAGTEPTSVGIDRSGNFAYVSNQNYPSPTGSISAYKINPLSGALTPITGSPYTEGNSPYAVAVDPLSGRFVYVVNVFSNNVSGYKIDQQHGTLTAIGGSPFPASSAPESLAIDPLGRFVYVPNTGSNDISAYTIDPNSGSLAHVNGSPFRAGSTPNSAAVDPSGAFLYVTNPNSQNISGFAID